MTSSRDALHSLYEIWQTQICGSFRPGALRETEIYQSKDKRVKQNGVNVCTKEVTFKTAEIVIETVNHLRKRQYESSRNKRIAIRTDLLK